MAIEYSDRRSIGRSAHVALARARSAAAEQTVNRVARTPIIVDQVVEEQERAARLSIQRVDLDRLGWSGWAALEQAHESVADARKIHQATGNVGPLAGAWRNVQAVALSLPQK